MGLKAGIDLGTTNSCIYVQVGQELIVVLDQFKKPTFPSVVRKSNGKLEIGGPARAKVGQSPPPIFEVKRKMGEDTRLELDGEQKTPAEISALILRHLKDLAEQYVQKNHPASAQAITDVVITCPAYFGAAARTATLEAGRLAGFTKIDLLQEPIAAALAYVQRSRKEQNELKEQRILVYDLGGGTFDITVLERRADGVPEVLDYSGDPWLGGSNFDSALGEYLRRHLVTQGYALEGLDEADPHDFRRIQQLKIEAENVKINLTARDPVEWANPNLFQDKEGNTVDLSLTVSREMFNDMTRDFMDKSIHLTHRLLALQSFADGHRLSAKDLEALDEAAIVARSRANAQHCEVILVGSSCWMPVVKERVTSELGRECRIAAPDVIVAEGAGIRVAAGGESEDLPTSKPGVVLKLAYPKETGDVRSIPIKGEFSGDVTGYSVTLVDDATGQEEQIAIGSKPVFLFRRDLRTGEANEFTLRVDQPGNDPILEHSFAITHDPSIQSEPPPPADTLSVPILIQTTQEFLPLFPANSTLPTAKEITLRTPDATGRLRVPFYEGEAYQAEILIDDAPMKADYVFKVRATMDKHYRVFAEAVMDTTEKKPSIDFQIKPRQHRTIEAINVDLARLRERFADRLGDVRDKASRMRFMGRRKAIEKEIEREINSLAPEIGHLEDLAAQFRKLVDEAGMVPQLKPTLDELLEQMNDRRPAPSTAEENTLKELLADAKTLWEAKDADNWNVIVRQCQQLTKNWGKESSAGGGRQPPPPEEVRAFGIQYLEEVSRVVQQWPDDASVQKDALQQRIKATTDKLRSASGNAIYTIHNEEVVPIMHQVEAGPKVKSTRLPPKPDF